MGHMGLSIGLLWSVLVNPLLTWDIGLSWSFQHLFLVCLDFLQKVHQRLSLLSSLDSKVLAWLSSFTCWCDLGPLDISTEQLIDQDSNIIPLLLSFANTIAITSLNNSISSLRFQPLLDQMLSWVVSETGKADLYPQIVWGELHPYCSQ